MGFGTIPDSDARPTDRLDPVGPYEITYLATRAALWDVIGTAALVVFRTVAGLLGVSLLAGGAVGLAAGENPVAYGAVTAVGATTFAVAGYRLVGLYRA